MWKRISVIIAFILCLAGGFMVGWYFGHRTAVAVQNSGTPSNCIDKNGKDIFNDPDAIEKSIKNSSGCKQAQHQAESCAYGSSVDVNNTSLASSVCEKELSTYSPSAAVTAALLKMRAACDATYQNREGTMFRSANGFCYLNAIVWATQLAQPDEGN